MQDIRSTALRARTGPQSTGYHCMGCQRGCVHGIGRVRIVDRHRRIVWCNQETHGIALANLLGKTLEEICCEDDRDLVLAASDAVLHKGKTLEVLVRDRFELNWWFAALSPAMAIGEEAGAVLETVPVCNCLPKLTYAQRRYLYRLTTCWSVEKIAGYYNVSESTVRTQLLRAKEKVKADTLSELILWGCTQRHVLGRYEGKHIL